MTLNNSEHTPGPWDVSLSDDPKSSGHYVTAPGHRSICKMTGGSWYGDCPMAHENLSNARLIASAPELIEAARGMIWAWNNPLGTKGTDVYANALQKAIDKAEGRI